MNRPGIWSGPAVGQAEMPVQPYGWVVSCRYYYFLTLPLAPTTDQAVIDAFRAVAEGGRPSASDLQRVPRFPAEIIAGWDRWLAADAGGARLAGAPVKLARIEGGDGPLALTIEFSIHDDAYADGGWVFEYWLYTLCAPPVPGSRPVVGIRQADRWDEPELISLGDDGVRVGERFLSGPTCEPPWPDTSTRPRRDSAVPPGRGGMVAHGPTRAP